ncbi:hypothetical protein ACVWWI_001560 [Bradyrhizobium sp. USDA 3686]
MERRESQLLRWDHGLILIFFHPTRWGQGVGFLKIVVVPNRKAGSNDPATGALPRGSKIEPSGNPDRLQKRLIMTDDEQRAVIGPQARFDGFDGFDVQMIGRLVEDQQRRRHRSAQHAGKACTKHLPAAQMSRNLQGGIGSKHEPGQRRMAFICTRLRMEAR